MPSTVNRDYMRGVGRGHWHMGEGIGVGRGDWRGLEGIGIGVGRGHFQAFCRGWGLLCRSVEEKVDVGVYCDASMGSGI